MAVKASDIIKIMQGWIGTDKRKIIDLYNSHKPLAQGYAVQYTDAWCDTTVSAAFIQAGAVDLIGGTECGVQRHIELFKKAGIWQEDGTVRPTPGAIICYNWDQHTQPNDGFADHIGVVESVSGNNVICIEGNYNEEVKRRTVPIGWGYIRGYAFPKYAAETAAPQPAAKPAAAGKVDISKPIIDVSEWQGIIDWAAVKPLIGGAIIRVAYGTNHDDLYVKRNLDECERLGIPYGTYIYSLAANETQARAEASVVKRWLSGRKPSLPSYLDLEENSLGYAAKTTAAAFCASLRDAGIAYGIYAGMYYYKGYMAGFTVPGWSVWVPYYGSNNGKKNPGLTMPIPYDGWQYTSVGRFAGISGNVDTSEFYTSFDNKSGTGGQTTAPAAQKSVEELAKEVLGGLWGNGDARVQRLTTAGYDAAAVQRRVNEMLKATPAPKLKSIDEIAKEVIAGKWSGGSDRINRLVAAGYDASAVQARVNQMLGASNTITYKVKAGDTLSTIARSYGVSYLRIAADNGIANPNFIYVGQVLKINR